MDIKKWASTKTDPEKKSLLGQMDNHSDLLAKAKQASTAATNYAGDDETNLKLQIKARDLNLEAAKKFGSDPMGSVLRDNAKGHSQAIAILQADIARSKKGK